jgi:hypothetical protein
MEAGGDMGQGNEVHRRLCIIDAGNVFISTPKVTALAATASKTVCRLFAMLL